MYGRQTSRREFLRSGFGLGSLALAGLTANQVTANTDGGNPLRYQPSHSEPKAKRVIMLYMEGGPSQIDMMDYKPELEKLAGKTIGLREDKYQFQGALMPSKWKFNPSLKTGLQFSELLPNLSLISDELCLLNGMHTDSTSHTPATLMLHTGAFNVVRPSVGSWVVYGLGTENENLPAFITINPVDHLGGTQNYSSAFLPASYQGTRLGVQDDVMPNLNGLNNTRQRRYLDLLEADNREYLSRHKPNPKIEAMIQSFELAFRMQSALPRVMELGNEPTHIKEMYGITGTDRNKFANQCLTARRLAEAGVRFIQLTKRGWDNHTDLPKSLPDRCRDIDQPIAGLILDLKQRGMLDETLVVWGGEFGRSSAEQNSGAGRRHQSLGYTMFLAGGGVKGGIKHGATDETGSRAVLGKVHIHDLHATILHLMGIDHEALTYRYAGRDFRLTDVYGNVVHEILA
jgi:hypothetical protein